MLGVQRSNSRGNGRGPHDSCPRDTCAADSSPIDTGTANAGRPSRGQAHSTATGAAAACPERSSRRSVRAASGVAGSVHALARDAAGARTTDHARAAVDAHARISASTYAAGRTAAWRIPAASSPNAEDAVAGDRNSYACESGGALEHDARADERRTGCRSFACADNELPGDFGSICDASVLARGLIERACRAAELRVAISRVFAFDAVHSNVLGSASGTSSRRAETHQSLPRA
jgi:hypothetical protein